MAGGAIRSLARVASRDCLKATKTLAVPAQTVNACKAAMQSHVARDAEPEECSEAGFDDAFVKYGERPPQRWAEDSERC